MNFERRLNQLEAQRGTSAQAAKQRKTELARDCEAFAARLAKIETTVREGANFAHRPSASPAENFVRACQRGEPPEVCRSFLPPL